MKAEFAEMFAAQSMKHEANLAEQATLYNQNLADRTEKLAKDLSEQLDRHTQIIDSRFDDMTVTFNKLFILQDIDLQHIIRVCENQEAELLHRKKTIEEQNKNFDYLIEEHASEKQGLISLGFVKEKEINSLKAVQEVLIEAEGNPDQTALLQLFETEREDYKKLKSVSHEIIAPLKRKINAQEHVLGRNALIAKTNEKERQDKILGDIEKLQRRIVAVLNAQKAEEIISPTDNTACLKEVTLLTNQIDTSIKYLERQTEVRIKTSQFYFFEN
jgi:hypothetical protein